MNLVSCTSPSILNPKEFTFMQDLAESAVPARFFRQFQEYLKRKGARMTSERRAILEQVFAYDGHFQAEDLLVRIRQQGYPGSRATIYRTLPLLVKSGLLTEVIDAQKNVRYERIDARQHHAHLICLRCGKIIEFKNPRIDALQTKECKARSFRPVRYRNEILGYCSECQAEGL
jgi:Fur family transcriptional regulator, ferric uptake regulator